MFLKHSVNFTVLNKAYAMRNYFTTPMVLQYKKIMAANQVCNSNAASGIITILTRNCKLSLKIMDFIYVKGESYNF